MPRASIKESQHAVRDVSTMQNIAYNIIYDCHQNQLKSVMMHLIYLK